jgi:putative flippase GtrA
MRTQLKEGTKQFFKFCLVGVVGATINYSIFFILFDIFGVYYIISSGTGFIISLIAAFSLN